MRENPRVVFIHFMGVGSANNLAQGIRSALNAQQGVMHWAAGSLR